MNGLPDPEMRKFLVNGTAQTVKNYLYPYVAQGLSISDINEDECTVTYNGKSATFPTSQQLKLTISAVNDLVGNK